MAPYLTVPVDHSSAKHTKNSIHIHNRRICLALILSLDKLTLFNLLYSDVGTASPLCHVFPLCHSLQPKVPLDDQSHCKAPYPRVTASSAITITHPPPIVVRPDGRSDTRILGAKQQQQRRIFGYKTTGSRTTPVDPRISK